MRPRRSWPPPPLPPPLHSSTTCSPRIFPPTLASSPPPLRRYQPRLPLLSRPLYALALLLTRASSLTPLLLCIPKCGDLPCRRFPSVRQYAPPDPRPPRLNHGHHCLCPGGCWRRSHWMQWQWTETRRSCTSFIDPSPLIPLGSQRSRSILAPGTATTSSTATGESDGIERASDYVL
ncbi:hypothetical protein COCNU_02G001970 [Cocos nucifera]|uniref:Uncharacterized protein n=1 Tax=Cocos nucifera TaxID=13894 RepID=A0A8K0MWJ2_COCNU|nr:hypothetical protein COCNU_02G001970 [Cocos nucifera]